MIIFKAIVGIGLLLGLAQVAVGYLRFSPEHFLNGVYLLALFGALGTAGFLFS